MTKWRAGRAAERHWVQVKREVTGILKPLVVEIAATIVVEILDESEGSDDLRCVEGIEATLPIVDVTAMGDDEAFHFRGAAGEGETLHVFAIGAGMLRRQHRRWRGIHPACSACRQNPARLTSSG